MVEAGHVDGNAIGGMLIELFGREMTDQDGCCDHCGAISALGAVHVYLDAPGTVVRCPNCGSVLIVIVEHPGEVRVNLSGIRWLAVAVDAGS